MPSGFLHSWDVAEQKGIWTLTLSLALMSRPRDRKCCTISMCPVRTATCRGVLSSCVGRKQEPLAQGTWTVVLLGGRLSKLQPNPLPKSQCQGLSPIRTGSSTISTILFSGLPRKHLTPRPLRGLLWFPSHPAGNSCELCCPSLNNYNRCY